MSTTAKVAFYVQFRRLGSGITATKMTQTRSKTPRGSGAISVKFVAEIPTWVFDPLDLVADTVIPAENTEPVIRLSSIGPVFPEPEPTA